MVDREGIIANPPSAIACAASTIAPVFYGQAGRIFVEMHSLTAYNACMKQVTVRNVSERSMDRARTLARERGSSLNQIFVEAIESGLGLTGQPRTNGLEKFAGDSDFGPEWNTYLEELRKVDARDWA
jgi:hypothetical protein